MISWDVWGVKLEFSEDGLRKLPIRLNFRQIRTINLAVPAHPLHLP